MGKFTKLIIMFGDRVEEWGPDTIATLIQTKFPWLKFKLFDLLLTYGLKKLFEAFVPVGQRPVFRFAVIDTTKKEHKNFVEAQEQKDLILKTGTDEEKQKAINEYKDKARIFIKLHTP